MYARFPLPCCLTLNFIRTYLVFATFTLLLLGYPHLLDSLGISYQVWTWFIYFFFRNVYWLNWVRSGNTTSPKLCLLWSTFLVGLFVSQLAWCCCLMFTESCMVKHPWRVKTTRSIADKQDDAMRCNWSSNVIISLIKFSFPGVCQFIWLRVCIHGFSRLGWILTP